LHEIYHQPSRDENSGKEPRPTRLKLKESFFTTHHEECWFYDEGDPEFLIMVDGRFHARSKVSKHVILAAAV
jgi:hypothetical protein